MYHMTNNSNYTYRKREGEIDREIVFKITLAQAADRKKSRLKFN